MTEKRAEFHVNALLIIRHFCALEIFAKVCIIELIMRNMRNIFLKMNLALGFVLALIPFVLYPVCENLKPDGTHMNCFYTGIFVTAMGIVVVILSFAFAKKFSGMAFVLAIIAAALTWLAPNGIVNIAGENWKIALCSVSSHACVADTMPKVALIASAIIVSSFAGLILALIKGDR